MENFTYTCSIFTYTLGTIMTKLYILYNIYLYINYKFITKESDFNTSNCICKNKLDNNICIVCIIFVCIIKYESSQAV